MKMDPLEFWSKQGRAKFWPTVIESDPAPDSEIIYKDDRCCILSPKSTYGVLVYTRQHSDYFDVIRREGLKTVDKRVREGLIKKPWRPYLNDCIFFRPFPLTPDKSSFVVSVRVCPYRTKVYDQEYHAKNHTTYREPFRTLHDYYKKWANLNYDYPLQKMSNVCIDITLEPYMCEVTQKNMCIMRLD